MCVEITSGTETEKPICVYSIDRWQRQKTETDGRQIEDRDKDGGFYEKCKKKLSCIMSKIKSENYVTKVSLKNELQN